MKFIKKKNTKKVYFISEIGINHNGKYKIAKQLIKISKKIGCNAVKFQIRHLRTVYNTSIYKNFKNLEHGNQFILHNLKKSHLSNKKYILLFKYAKSLGLDVIITPFDIKSLKLAKHKLVDCIKIGSPDFESKLLIKEAIKIKKKIILSTGMSNTLTIKKVSNYLKKNNCKPIFLHCCSSYPPSLNEINLKFIDRIKNITKCDIGYSGHEVGYGPSLVSLFFGVKYIERHITLNKRMSGPDHSSSLNPKEFKRLIVNSNKILRYLNNDNKNIKIDNFLSKFNLKKFKDSVGQSKTADKFISQNAKFNKKILGKSLIVTKNFKKNNIIDEKYLAEKTPAYGINFIEYENIKNKKLVKNIKQNEYLQKNHFYKEKFKKININKKWGIIGRLGDFEDFIHLKPNILEIHLTWRDLINYKKIYKKYSQELVVHAPEYFNDQLVDFTTNNKKILNNSIEMIKTVIKFTRDIQNNFNNKDPRGTKIILHPGGHSFDNKNVNIKEKYLNLSNNLKTINTHDTRILLENMPPYPWYFGGQYYQNIFTDQKYIKDFCELTKIHLCFDTSHAQLYCNLNKINLIDYIKDIKKFISYFHISDAHGVNNEGMQIGEGNINFLKFLKLFSKMDLGFVPEVWQGHLNHGEGFKIALRNIEVILKKISSKHKCS